MKLRTRLHTVAAALSALAIVLTCAVPRDVGPGSPFQPTAAAVEDGDSRQPAPCGRSQTPITEGKPAQAWFQDPIGRMAYVSRMARYLGGEPQRNIAIAFVDITGLDNLDTRGYQVMDVSALKSGNRPLYDTLRLADRPNIQRIAIVPDSNVPQAPGTNGSQHSEQMVIFKDLTYLSPFDGGASITPDRVFAFYSDRSPCGPKKNDCAGLMCATTDVFYATMDDPPAPPRSSRKTRSGASAQPTAQDAVPPNDTSAVQDMKRFISEAQAQAEGSAEIKEEIEAEQRRNKQRAAAEQSRKKAIAESGKTIKDGIERRDLFRASAAKASNAGTSTNSPGPTAGTDSGFAQVLAQPLVAAPGGIDFSHLQLGYLADPGDGSGLQYAFQAPSAASGGGTPSGALDTAALSSDAFFVWLELDPSTFWVNLNPTEPDRVVDPQMGQTDVGRIMLQADLRLKQDVGTLIHPGTSLGDQFWSRIDGDCLSSRVWVVPAPAQVYSTGDKLYILSAPLDVRMESDYVQLPPGQSSAVSCPQQDDATQAHNEALFRSLILPQLVNLVNADLAQDVSQSLTTPTVAGSDTIWLGAPTPLQAAHASRASAPPASDGLSPLSSATLRWLLVLLLPILALARRRRARTRR